MGRRNFALSCFGRLSSRRPSPTRVPSQPFPSQSRLLSVSVPCQTTGLVTRHAALSCNFAIRDIQIVVFGMSAPRRLMSCRSSRARRKLLAWALEAVNSPTSTRPNHRCHAHPITKTTTRTYKAQGPCSQLRQHNTLSRLAVSVGLGWFYGLSARPDHCSLIPHHWRTRSFLPPCASTPASSCIVSLFSLQQWCLVICLVP